MVAYFPKQSILHLKWLMVYALIYSLVLSTGTPNCKLYYLEDTYIHTFLYEMVTYYTYFSCYFFKLDTQFLD